MLPIISWFTDTYVGHLRNNGTRAPPLFPFNVWNVFERTIAGLDRTNNFCEACHKKIQIQLGIAHPTIWKFLESLKNIIKVSDADYELFVGGRDPTAKRPKYQELDNNILTIVNRYEFETVIEYLRGISHNFTMA